MALAAGTGSMKLTAMKPWPLIFSCLCLLAANSIAETSKDLMAAGLASFRPVSNWHLVERAVAVPDRTELSSVGKGPILINGLTKDISIPYLMTRDIYGDCKVRLEFMIPKNSNAGIYMMGRYEVQILDSFGKEKVGSGDLGGIYARWDKTKPAKEQWSEGTKPLVNAAKAPGAWQTMDIVFRAPKFDAKGIKTTDATFESVHINGQLVQQNATTSGPTASAPLKGDVIAGPIAIQGDHGPIAIRKLEVTPLPCAATSWLEELDAYWSSVEKAVSTGDFVAYTHSIHPDGVIVAGGKQSSYPLAQALARWKSEFDATKSGKVKTRLEFRFAHRYGDPTTAHESGIFAYTDQQPDQEPKTTYIDFEGLLIKKDGTWQLMMEYQKGETTEDAWKALAPAP